MNLIQFQGKQADHFAQLQKHNPDSNPNGLKSFDEGYTEVLENKYGESKQRPYNGYVSPNTKRSVSKYIETWVESVRTCKMSILKKYKDVLPYFTFVTLSLSSAQRHDDKFIKKNLLVRFIDKMRKAGKFKHYFWRAEPQKNGNIHFHLIVDAFIDYEYLRNQWNETQANYGYIEPYTKRQTEKYKNGFFIDYTMKRWDKKAKRSVLVSPETQKKAYEFGVETGWTQPNSTDIRKIAKVYDLTSYLLKYFTKNGKQETRGNYTCIENRTIEGRIIGKSDGLEKLDTFCISEFDASFLNWIDCARDLGCVEKTIDVVGNGSVVCVLGRFMASLRQHEFKRKLMWFHLHKIRQLYELLIPCPEDLMDNPY